MGVEAQTLTLRPKCERDHVGFILTSLNMIIYRSTHFPKNFIIKWQEEEEEGQKKEEGQQTLAHLPGQVHTCLSHNPSRKAVHLMFVCGLSAVRPEGPVASRHPCKHFETPKSTPRSGLSINLPFRLQRRPGPPALALLKCGFHSGTFQMGLSTRQLPHLPGPRRGLIFRGDAPPPNVCPTHCL